MRVFYADGMAENALNELKLSFAAVVIDTLKVNGLIALQISSAQFAEIVKC